MPMIERWRHQLATGLARADLERLTLHDAAELLRRLVPSYAEFRRAVPDVAAVRWYEDAELAIADGIWRATHRPYDPDWPLFKAIGRPVVNEDGLWSVGAHAGTDRFGRT